MSWLADVTATVFALGSVSIPEGGLQQGNAILIGILAQLGSLYVTRPSLLTYTAKPADLTAMAAELFGAVTSGNVRIDIKQRYQLKDADQAHRDLEARKTIGSSILLPD